MNGKQFTKAVRELAKRNGVSFREENRGKGSHERVYYGDKFTTVKHGDIGLGLLSAMCRQLGNDKRDL
jgi:mRNA interferase HicA